MACQVLNRFGIYRCMNEIGNVSMPQLMGCYFKVQTVNHFSVMSSLFSQDRCDSMLYSFSIFIPIIAPLLDRPRNNILPKSLKLRVGQRCAMPVLPSDMEYLYPDILNPIAEQEFLPGVALHINQS